MGSAQDILGRLRLLCGEAKAAGHEVEITWHEERSGLVRLAGGAVSLNTDEHLVRVDIAARLGRRRASCQFITGSDDLDALRAGVRSAAEMARHAEPLGYEPSRPVYAEEYVDEGGCDPRLASLPAEECIRFATRAASGLEGGDLDLAGMVSRGETVFAAMNTRSEHGLLFRHSDAQASLVLSHRRLKWEIGADQSAWRLEGLDPEALRGELSLLARHYASAPRVEAPSGVYDAVLGRAALGHLLEFLEALAFQGEWMKRGYGFLKETDIGNQVLSERFNLIDDPVRLETFPWGRDLAGLVRRPFPLAERGVLRAFAWSRDGADEFGAAPTGHDVPRKSLVMAGGRAAVDSLEDLLATPRERDTLYIPALHYMNMVSPSQGIVTATSRFGTLLLEQDGTVAVPGEFRLTASLRDIFGKNLSWLSRRTLPVNISNSYAERNPTAVVVPAFMGTTGLELEKVTPPV